MRVSVHGRVAHVLRCQNTPPPACMVPEIPVLDHHVAQKQHPRIDRDQYGYWLPLVACPLRIGCPASSTAELMRNCGATDPLFHSNQRHDDEHVLPTTEGDYVWLARAYTQRSESPAEHERRSLAKDTSTPWKPSNLQNADEVLLFSQILLF